MKTLKYPKAKAFQRIVLVLIFSLLALHSIYTVFPQTSSSTTVAVKPSASTPRVGETITVNITLANVQNLYGLDVTLQWNASVLQVLNVNLRLGVESHSDGVLHEASNGNIFVEENDASQELGEYRLVATSVAPAASFSGSGNIVIITFKVISAGHSELDLTSELADYNPSGSSFINHIDIDGVVDSVIPEGPDSTPPTIFIVSPENKTYNTDNIFLNFTMSEPTSWISYSLDGQTNVTIAGNTTIAGLSDGSHSLIVYAKDNAGNEGASEIVFFSVAQKTEPQPEPSPTAWIVAAIAIATVGVAFAIYYFTKNKKTAQTTEK